MKIKDIKANWIADSNMGKSVGVWIYTDQGYFFGAAPQGTSSGKYEAKVVNIDEAIENINAAIPEIIKINPLDLDSLDKYLVRIGGSRMEKFGANASVALSSAWAKMSAAASNKTLWRYLADTLETEPRIPVPMFNIINGGLHGAIDKDGDPFNPIQELMLIPTSAEFFEQGYLMVIQVFHALRSISGESLVGLEGGFSPPQSLETSIQMIQKAIKYAGFNTDNFQLAIDAAASEFYKDGFYMPQKDGDRKKIKEMVEFYKNLIKESPIKIFSIEDSLAEDEFEGFALLNKELKDDTLLVGDDLFVTQTERVKRGIEHRSAGGVLVKINQNGTVSGTLETIKFGLENDLLHIISHRSKVVPGDFINAHLAIAVGQMIKHGSSRGERIEVYNELMRVERESSLPYAGNSITFYS